MKILIYGPQNHVFTNQILEKYAQSSDVKIEVCENWNGLLAALSQETEPLLKVLLINKAEKEALKIVDLQPSAEVFMCHGGEEEFKPDLILINSGLNHERMMFDSWEDFFRKLEHPPRNKKPLLSITDKSQPDIYRLNYGNFPALLERQRESIDQKDKKFFWFSILFSKIYLHWWINVWAKYVFKMQWHMNLPLEGRGKTIKRLTIPLENTFKGELIFREGDKMNLHHPTDDLAEQSRRFAGEERDDDFNGEETPFSSKRMFKKDRKEQWDEFLHQMSPENNESEDEGALPNSSLHYNLRNLAAIGKVVAADTDSVEIIFEKPTAKTALEGKIRIAKGASILPVLTEAYAAYCAGYSEISDNDWLYSQENHYNRPEDFFRGNVRNYNPLHLPINEVLLDGPSKAILFDQSQMESLLDILSPSFVTLVKGGPGTGKTLLTAVAIKQLVRNKRVVFVTSHSNKGLDNILEVLMQHVDNRLIFRFGNEAESITVEKVKKLHRHYRYQKIREKEKEKFEKQQDLETQGDKRKARREFDGDSFDVSQEINEIWKLICSGQGMVIAATANSLLFDRSFKDLYDQNYVISNVDFTDLTDQETKAIPKPVLKYMAGNDKIVRPYFSLDVSIIDEATKLRIYELLPILKRTNYKVVETGDYDQLGNLAISPLCKDEIMETINDYCRPTGNMVLLTPQKLSEGDNELIPMTTTLAEINSHFDSFAVGPFSALLKDGVLTGNHLNVNRRSLENIVRFLNYVFRQNMQIGRFNPYYRGEVYFLDVRGEEEKVKTSYRNRKEKSYAVTEMLNSAAKQKRQEGKIKLSSHGIITGYRGQIGLIKEKLRKELLFNKLFEGLVTENNIDQILKELVNTVDAFQGSEKDKIIFCSVRSNLDNQIGFMTDISRFYVAVSRGRTSLVIIGNPLPFLANKDTKQIFRRIMHFTKRNKTYSLKG